MFERYTEKARRVIFFGRYEASQFGSPFIETEHLLLGLLREDPDLAIFFPGEGNLGGSPAADAPPEVAEAELRVESIIARMQEAIARHDFRAARSFSDEERKERKNLHRLRQAHNLPTDGDASEGSILTDIRSQIEATATRREKYSTSVDLPLSHEAKRVLAYGAEEAERLNQRHIGTEHLLLGLLREEKSFAAGILHARGLRLSLVRQQVAQSPPAEFGRTLFGLRRKGGPGFGPGTVHFERQSGFWKVAMQDAGRVLHLARNEAAKRNSQCVETTDLLLALTLEKEITGRFPGLAESIRQHRKPEPEAEHEKVSVSELPFSEECKFACTFATEEAAQLGQRTGPGHLLLGILRVESSAAARILRDCGFTEAGIRAQLAPPPPPSDPEQGRNYV
jgi:ATP-dependent Clp protease ATP-binding subunit ClpA